MKIIAEFQDKDYLDESFGEDEWFWGLGDDGELYYKYSYPRIISGLPVWEDFYNQEHWSLSFRDIMIISKEFGRFWDLKAFW